MKFAKKLSLPVWIFIGMFAGILVGLCFLKNPAFTTDYLKPIGTIYINLLKFLVVPVVLFSIMDGVISLKDLRRVGSVGIKTFVYYMVTTAVAVTIGLILVSCFKGAFPALPSAELSELSYEAKETPKIMDVIVGIFPDNLFAPMVKAIKRQTIWSTSARTSRRFIPPNFSAKRVAKNIINAPGIPGIRP